jgi:hypothetical protein
VFSPDPVPTIGTDTGENTGPSQRTSETIASSTRGTRRRVVDQNPPGARLGDQLARRTGWECGDGHAAVRPDRAAPAGTDGGENAVGDPTTRRSGRGGASDIEADAGGAIRADERTNHLATLSNAIANTPSSVQTTSTYTMRITSSYCLSVKKSGMAVPKT